MKDYRSTVALLLPQELFSCASCGAGEMEQGEVPARKGPP